MMKKLALVTVLLLSINFLAVAGGVGYLVGTGKLDAAKAREIGKILFPDAPPPTTQPATTRPTTQPLFQIDELLERTRGKTGAEQAAYVREMIDAATATLERTLNEIKSRQGQLDLGQAQLARDRAVLAQREKVLADREKKQKALDADEGFQKTLEVYNSMETKQIKELFMKLDEPTVVRYLQAMEPRRVSRIVKEFTAPEELSKAQSLLEAMRKNDALTPEAKTSASSTTPPAAAASNAAASSAASPVR